MKAVILAAGLGTRMRPYTYFVPKAMLPLGNKPALEHILDWLKENSVTHVILCVSYLRHMIESYFGDGSHWNMRIEYVYSEKPMGTAGQLKTAEHKLEDTFLCIYSDSILRFNLSDVEEFHRKRGAAATILLVNYEHVVPYGFVELDSEGVVRGWREKPVVRGLINTGYYLMEPRFLKYIPENTPTSMDAAFQRAIENKETILGRVVEGEFIDLGDKRSYTQAYKRYLERLGPMA